MTAIRYQKILGIRFFAGSCNEAIELVTKGGGLVVVPSGPGLRTLATDNAYREALLGADLAIADSGFMVLQWNLCHWPWISKLSGLKYLRALQHAPGFRAPGATFWVMPNQQSVARAQVWLQQNGISADAESMYVAPHYNGCFEDPDLVAAIEKKRPRHVVLGLGGNTQEPLGLYLKKHLSYLPSIHCVGAAIGFLTGDQVHIPVWVDHVGLGWLWRTFSDPKRFLPRYWEARHLCKLMIRYWERLPVSDASIIE